MDERKEPYIEQQAAEDALYTRLQQQTLAEVQRMSGKVWTDYNAHDPGVTLADIANYALAELDYKLGFGVADSLTEAGKPFDAARFGLFPPVDVYTTSPVTVDDYRRMLLATVPGLENADVHCDPETGAYTVRILLSPFEEGSGEDTVRQVEEAFHSRRNLCERLDKVEIIRPDTLDFEAELEIEPGEDATEVLARIYGRILRYLSGEASLLTPGSCQAEGVSPETWLEGSEDALRVVLPEQEDTEHELYKQLRGIKGVSRFRTCYLTKGGIPQTRLSGPYSLRIPKERKDFGNIRMCCGRTEARIDPERFLERLEGFHLLRGRSLSRKQRGKENRSAWSRPAGTGHDVSAHAPIAGDFPDCYRLSPERKQPSSFEAYTRLYDRAIQNGLDELKALPRLLSLKEEDETTDYKYPKDAIEKKSHYLDFLDRLYGVKSHPAWLSEENSYGETPAGTLRHRVNFLRNAARLEKERMKARNLLEADGNAPTVKEHFCLLLGIDPDDGHTVSNVLPGHNLRLLERKQEEDGTPGITDRIDSLLIGERMLRPGNVQPVEFERLARDEEGKRKEYAEMRATLPFFNENLITGDLFRGGTRLGNYKIVRTDDDLYMLMYRHQEHGGWTNLGQGTDPKELARLANILRRFLRELNRRSETLYVVEPVLADGTRTFELILALPAWTYRFHSPRFRSKCRELLRSLVPAHLTGKVHWLGEKEMRQFEICYHQLMRTYTDSRLADYRGKLLEAIDELTAKAEETQDLDDTD